MTTLLPALPALAAALLFGASTPFAKLLGADIRPQLLAGLLYLGSGIGLAVVLWARRWLRREPLDGGSGGSGGSTGSSGSGPSSSGVTGRSASPAIARQDLPWLAGAIVAGGVLGPVLLMAGLVSTQAAPAALLLNVEGVLTALIAWGVFKENADWHVVLGMLAIVAGGMLLAWQPGHAQSVSTGALLIVAACLCWAVDNNLTRKVSANDALLIACLKGGAAGVVNTALGLLSGAHLPPIGWLAATLLLGFAGYGLSLAFFVVALRTLGTARTGAYFSVAPLFGVLIAFALWPARLGWTFWAAAALMTLGVWLHLRERHAHLHTHSPLRHDHPHTHDDHHRHTHDFAWDGSEPHVHPHRHATLTHAHAHYPDIHHRHQH